MGSVATSRIIIDQYAPLSHKALVGDPRTPIQGVLTVPGWVPLSERRRLCAYIVRAAYMGNVARKLLLVTPEEQETRREYGDADLIVDRIIAGVLGDHWSIVVDGAQTDGNDIPELPEQPVDPGDDASVPEQRIFKIAQSRWLDEATKIVDEWEQQQTMRPLLQARQDALRGWADSAQLAARFTEAERDCTGLGDTIMVLWPTTGGWPTITVYDPGFYFPVLDDNQTEDYPTKVHLAWELNAATGQTDTVSPTHVRRITFELVDLTELHTGSNRGGRYWLGPEGERAAAPNLAANEQVDETGRVYRILPWDMNPDGTEATTPGPLDTNGKPTPIPARAYRTCLVTDAMWPIGNIGVTADALDDTNAIFRVTPDGTTLNRLDLGCDFLPLVHIPNTPSGKEHYGRAALDQTAQILDDLSTSDTDLMTASRYFAGPVLSLANAQTDGVTTVQPGIVFNLGENGRMDALDMSKGFASQVEHNQKLQDRFFVSSRVPAEMIGRVSAAKAISGVAMALAFSPFAQVIGVARMARDPKHRLVYKFAQRLAQLQGLLPPGPDINARTQFGNFMPAERDSIINTVAVALGANGGHQAISLQTAVAMMVAAGLPVPDAQVEVERILSQDTAGALNVAEATGSEGLAADRLGLELPPKPPAPVVLPPSPTGAP